jgi:zinc transporter ZupT
MTVEAIFALAAASLFAAVHVLSPALYRLGHLPRAWWVSAAGGTSVAYVFLHLLPDLARHERALAETHSGELVYVLALAGLAAFYGLERGVRIDRPRDRAPPPGAEADGTFWVHLGAFAVYNLLVGYLLLHRGETTLPGLVLYAVALALHLVTVDLGLRHDHVHVYDRLGRWILAGSVLAGAGLSGLVTLPDQAVIALSSVLAGAILLNVLKEELPESRESRFLPFAAGAAIYSVPLLLIL